MKFRIWTFVFLFSLKGYAQNDSSLTRHNIGILFGGQSRYALNYEYSIVADAHLNFNAIVGLGWNADKKNAFVDMNTALVSYEDNPIYALHSGIKLLLGSKPLFLEISPYATTYFYGKTTFVNFNSSIGLRLSSKLIEGLYLATGYSPRLYTTFSDPRGNYSNIEVYFKIGFFIK